MLPVTVLENAFVRLEQFAIIEGDWPAVRAGLKARLR